MDGQLRLQTLLRSELDKRQSKQPDYSIRKFAKTLDVSPSALNEILRGKRRVSSKLASRITTKLSVSPKEALEIEYLLKKRAEEQGPSEAEGLYLDDVHKVYSDWAHMAVFNLFDLDGFRPQVDWVAQRLNLPERTVQGVLDRLVRVGAVEMNGGRYVKGVMKLRIPHEIREQVYRASQVGTLQLAQKVLQEGDLEAADFATVTFSMNSQNLKLAKGKVRQFLSELSKLSKSDTKDRVYKLCVQLLPL